MERKTRCCSSCGMMVVVMEPGRTRCCSQVPDDYDETKPKKINFTDKWDKPYFCPLRVKDMKPVATGRFHPGCKAV